MNGHEHERLSAYLDGELVPGERARVAAHLDTCAECGARLAELAAVDEATACMPAEAPQGYFESFPTRVRARLEPRAAARRLPAWTWAAAAALLLAVVTPLTLLRQPEARSSLPAPEIPAAAQPSLAKAQASPEAPQPEARVEPKAEGQGQFRPRQVPVLASPAPAKRASGFAAAPSEADAPATREPVAAGASRPSVPAPAVAAREEAVAAVADETATPEALGSGAQNQAAALRDRKRAESHRDAAETVEAAEPMLARGRAAAPAGGMVAAPKRGAAEAEWRRLDMTRPRTPAEWRRLREDWRLYVARDPDGPRADEARVRMIEAGREAWRGGSEPADEAQFRKDVAEYLTRDDAAQKERVTRLLR